MQGWNLKEIPMASAPVSSMELFLITKLSRVLFLLKPDARTIAPPSPNLQFDKFNSRKLTFFFNASEMAVADARSSMLPDKSIVSKEQVLVAITLAKLITVSNPIKLSFSEILTTVSNFLDIYFKNKKNKFN